MRRLLGALVTCVLVGGGCTSDGSPEPARGTPDTAVVDDLVPLTVANGAEIARFVDGRSEALFRFSEGDAALALSGPEGEGIVAQQRFDDRSDVVRIVDGRSETIAKNAGLLGTAVVEGTPMVVYATCNEAPGKERRGDIVLFDVRTSDTRRLADACGVEYGVSRVSFGGGVFVASATSDLTEVFRFYEPDGDEVEDRPNPTDDLPYNEPPFLSDAVLSPDGSSLAYLEAPDVSGVTGSQQKRSGDFNVVVIDERKGNELARVKLPDPATQYRRLDYDGRWLVISEGEGARVRVVDTDADDPRQVAIGAEGIASIMRS